VSGAVAFREPAVTFLDGPNEPARFHEFANLFPLLEGDAYWALVDDIKAHGVREPIVMLGNAILDGRNRYLAARDAGVGYPVTQFDGADPLAFVVSLNLKRRHLSESQRAMVASKLAKLPPGRPSETAPIEAVSQSQAADMLNVGRSAVQRAAIVRDHGTPGLVALVETGEASVSAAAQVAMLPEAAQAEVVAEGAEAVREVAAAIRTADAGAPEASEDDKAAMRATVVEAAMRGLKGGQKAPSRRNPDYDPDPKFNAMASVAGSCRSIADKVSEHGIAFILGGFLDDAMRARNVETFRAGRDALNQILDACDAE